MTEKLYISEQTRVYHRRTFVLRNYDSVSNTIGRGRVDHNLRNRAYCMSPKVQNIRQDPCLSNRTSIGRGRRQDRELYHDDYDSSMRRRLKSFIYSKMMTVLVNKV